MQHHPGTEPLAVDSGRVGGYVLHERIGEGGMGVVHRATDPTGRIVAVKLLRPHVASDSESRARFAREARVLARVRGEHVAQVLDADVAAATPYLVTDFVDGPPLHQVVDDEGPLDGPDLSDLAGDLADALCSIHAAGVIHRDLKPGNVLLEDGLAVVIDFGIAQIADDTRITMPGLVYGTPGYVAPEILQGSEVTAASDIHAWAATVAYAATGRSPFGKGPLDAVAFRVLQEAPDLDGCPEWILPVLDVCFAKDPAARPSAPELLRWLETGQAPESRTVTLTRSGDGGTTPMPIAGATEDAVDGDPSAARPTEVYGAAAFADGHPTEVYTDGHPTSVYGADGHADDPTRHYADPAAYRQGHHGGPYLPRVAHDDGATEVAGYPAAGYQPAGYQPAGYHDAGYPPAGYYAGQHGGPYDAGGYPGGEAYADDAYAHGGYAAGADGSGVYRAGAADDETAEERQPEPAGDPWLFDQGSRRSRGVVVLAFATLAALAAVVPVVAAVALLGWLVLSRTVDRTTAALARRRMARGRRATDWLVAVVTLPWHGFRALLVTVLTVPIAAVGTAIVVGVVTLFFYAGAIPPRWDVVVGAAGLVLSALAWWGVEGDGVQRGSYRMLAAVLVRRWVTVAAWAVLGLLVLMLLTVASTEPVWWWPLEAPPLPDLGWAS